MSNKKLIYHVELNVGNKLTEDQLQKLIEKDFDKCIQTLIRGLDLEIDFNYCYATGFDNDEN